MRTKMTALLIAVLMLALFISGCSASKELINTSTSPNGRHTVEAYRFDGGATTSWLVRVYLVDNGGKEEIYAAYRVYNAEITWLDDNRLTINGITLDLSKGETYHW